MKFFITDEPYYWNLVAENYCFEDVDRIIYSILLDLYAPLRSRNTGNLIGRVLEYDSKDFVLELSV